jgi:phage shock protein C
VAGGIADFTNIDPLWVRVAFLVLSLFNGLGTILYLILWLLMPIEGSQTTDTRSQVRENVNDMQEATQRFAQQVRDMFRN